MKMLSDPLYQVGIYYHDQDFPSEYGQPSWIGLLQASLKTLIAQSRMKALQVLRAQETFSDMTLVVLSEYLIQEYPKQRPNSLKDKSLLKILPEPVPLNRQPLWLQSVPEYHFFEYNPYLERFEKFLAGPRRLDIRYWQVLDDLVEDLVTLVDQRLFGHESSSSCIYLGVADQSLLKKREELKRMLKHWGYQIRPQSAWQSPLGKKAMEREISKCKAAVHLLGSEYGDKVPRQIQEIASLEYDIAASQPECLQFVWKGIQPPSRLEKDLNFEQNPPQPKVLSRQYVFDKSFIHFKQELISALSQKNQPEQNTPYVFGVSIGDQPVDWSELEAAAQKKGWKFILFESQKSWAHIQRLIGNAEAVVLVETPGSNNLSTQHWCRLMQKSVAYATGQQASKKYWVGQPPNPNLGLVQVTSLAQVARQLKRQAGIT